MKKTEKILVKSSFAITRFAPRERRELVVRGLNAIMEAKDADYYFFKGEEYRILGKVKQAISFYEKALRINNEHEDSLFWGGYCYLPDVDRTGDDLKLDHAIRCEKAVSAFLKLIEVRKNKDNILSCNYVYCNLGVAQSNLGLYKEAIESYERAIELNPDDADYYYNLGIAQRNLGLYKEAIESYERAIELNPDKPDYYCGLGVAQYNLGLYKEAIESYERAIEINPDNANYYYNLGIAQKNLGLYKEAIESYERAIEINPDDADYYCNLGIAQKNLGLYKIAEFEEEQKTIIYCINCGQALRIPTGKTLKVTCKRCYWVFDYSP